MEAIIGIIVLVLIGIPLIPVILSIRLFSRLARQERALDALADKVTRLEVELRQVRLPRRTPEGAEAGTVLAPEGERHEVPPAIPHPPATPEPVPSSAQPGGFRLQAEAVDDDEESLETQIGSRWLLYVGVAAIVIGAAYFEKLAIENGWIGETARIIQGAVVGLALVVAGTRFVRAGYGRYGQMISACGAAILYVTTFAAFALYHLIDRPVAFVLMVAITIMVAALADRQRAQGLAVMAVGGGFATPFLIHGNSDLQVALLGYDAILVGGTVFLSSRRDWPLLNVVSYVFTVLTVAAWADRFYTPSKYLTTELFLTLFCAMFLYILRECRRSESGAGQLAAIVLWTAPVAYYLASLVILAEHSTALLVWLVGLMLAGGFASAAVSAGAGLAVWMAVTVPLLLWTVTLANAGSRAAGLATVAGIYAIALAAQLRGMMESDEDNPVHVIWLHLNGLLMFAAAYFLIAPVRVAMTGPLAAAVAVWNGALAGAIAGRRRDYARHFGALGFTLLSIAIALQFDGPAVTVGWAAEGAVIVALGLRERRGWLRLGGVALFAVAVVRALELLVGVAPIRDAIFFNARALSAAFVAALAYVLAWLHRRDAEAPDRALGIAAPLIVAQIVTLAVLTSEINAYFARHEGRLEQELMTSVTWGVYSTALIVIGLWKRYAPIRYFAMVVFFVTIAKVFFFDLAELERIYRVISIVALGVLLLLTSYLYQRSRASAAGE